VHFANSYHSDFLLHSSSLNDRLKASQSRKQLTHQFSLGPTSTCVCILPSVTFTTTVLPGQTQGQETRITTAPPTSTQSVNTPPPPRPTTASQLEANDASKAGVEAGLGLFGLLCVALAGLL